MAISSSMKSADKTNLLGKRKREPKYEGETEWTLNKHEEGSEEKETTQGFADHLQEVKGVELSTEANLIPVVMETVEGLDETPHFVEGVSARKKTLIIDNLSPHTKIPDIINFFKDVWKVVSVRIMVNRKGSNLGFGSVEFASANEAEKAQEQKNGEYLCDKRITLGLAKITPYPQRPRFCKEHKVWYKDYIRRECFFPIVEEEIPPHFFEAIAAREETIFVANLSPQTKILHIIEFFKNVGGVISVRLIVNRRGRHVGYGFVEFADAYGAKKALEENGKYLHGHKIFLDGAKAAPCSPRPKYSLAEKLRYEDYLLQKGLLIGDETVEAIDESPDFVEAVVVRKKTLIIDNLSLRTKISDIIKFFKDVAAVVHVRLIVDKSGYHAAYGFVEFASADEAMKAQEKKNGEYLCGHHITLGMAEIAPCTPLPMYCIDHKVWYEDYLRGESRLIEEDEAVEGLDEFVEEVSSSKKTLFIDNLPPKSKIHNITNFFQEFGEVSVRLLVDYEGKPLGCGFVKFASAIEAKKAIVKKNQRLMSCHFICLQIARIAPYPLRPKYNLAEKLWYKDYLPLESLWIEEEKMKKRMKMEFCGKKITFSDDDD